MTSTPTRNFVAPSLHLVAMALTFVFASGFAPFNSGGLATFSVQQGSGDPDLAGGAGEGSASIETDAIFHTLSSRYGGGGAAIFMEFLPAKHGFSGMLLIDLRHAGLYDLYDPQVLALPNRKRAELYYQQWVGSKDTFNSDKASGTITVEELFRGEGQSAMGISFELTFRDASSDEWRRISGVATTLPTVKQALEREAIGFYDETSRDNYAPDGNIYVNCFGEVVVEDETYEEDSYAYEDQDGGCTGDTWEDDSETPDEDSGCDAKEPVDEGEPDAETGCDDSGPDVEDPDDSESDDLYYDDAYDDESESCEGDDVEQRASAAGARVSVALADLCLDPAEVRASSSVPRSSRRLHSHELEIARHTLARIARGERLEPTSVIAEALMRHTRATVFSKEDYRSVRRILSYLPFFLLALGIHVVRRRMRRA